MKTLGVILGLMVVAALAFFFWPRLTPGSAAHAGSGNHSPNNAIAAPGTYAGRVVEAPKPDQPLSPPLTPGEKLREDYSEKRVPFYHFLHQNFGDTILSFRVVEALDTLDVVIVKDDDATLHRLMDNAFSPSADQYGFRKIRFLVRNREGSIDPYRLVAEVALDDSGHWTIWRK